MNLKQYLKLILSDQSSDNSESDDSSDELPDLEDSDRDSEYSDVDSEDSEDSEYSDEDSEDSDEEGVGPGAFLHFFFNAMASEMFGKLNFTGRLKYNWVFYRLSHIKLFLIILHGKLRDRQEVC